MNNYEEKIYVLNAMREIREIMKKEVKLARHDQELEVEDLEELKHILNYQWQQTKRKKLNRTSNAVIEIDKLLLSQKTGVKDLKEIKKILQGGYEQGH